VASRGRHTWSHPHLPLPMPEADLEVIIRNGKASEGENSIAKPGNLPYPFVGTPFSSSQLPSRPFSKVSHFLNFWSVPAEFSPPSLGLEREILVTPLSPKFVPWRRPRITEDFPTPSFTTPPLVTIVATA
jgi:hypothetical protein